MIGNPLCYGPFFVKLSRRLFIGCVRAAIGNHFGRDLPRNLGKDTFLAAVRRLMTDQNDEGMDDAMLDFAQFLLVSFLSS